MIAIFLFENITNMSFLEEKFHLWIFFLRKVSLEVENITGVDSFLRRIYQQCHFSGVKYQTRYFSKIIMWIVIDFTTDMFSVRNITCKEKFTFDIFLMKNTCKKKFVEKNVSSETFLEENISSCMHFYRKSSCVRKNITCLKEVHLWYFPEGKLSPEILLTSSETFLEENVASYMQNAKCIIRDALL